MNDAMSIGNWTRRAKRRPLNSVRNDEDLFFHRIRSSSRSRTFDCESNICFSCERWVPIP